MNRVSAIQQIEQYFDQDEFFPNLVGGSRFGQRVKFQTSKKICLSTWKMRLQPVWLI